MENNLPYGARTWMKVRLHPLHTDSHLRFLGWRAFKLFCAIYLV